MLNRTDRRSPGPGEAEVNYLDGDFPEHALHQQHRGRVGLVEDAVTGGEQFLETAPAYEGVPVIAGPGQEGRVGRVITQEPEGIAG